jgi:hypothetical protein
VTDAQLAPPLGYHFSAGVPDEEVEELQRRWLG